MYNPAWLQFWLKQSENYSILLQNRGWLGRIWQCSTRNLSLIPLPGLMYFSDEPILSVYWYSYNEQPHIVAFLHYRPESPHDWGLDK